MDTPHINILDLHSLKKYRFLDPFQEQDIIIDNVRYTSIKAVADAVNEKLDEDRPDRSLIYWRSIGRALYTSICNTNDYKKLLLEIDEITAYTISRTKSGHTITYEKSYGTYLGLIRLYKRLIEDGIFNDYTINELLNDNTVA